MIIWYHTKNMYLYFHSKLTPFSIKYYLVSLFIEPFAVRPFIIFIFRTHFIWFKISRTINYIRVAVRHQKSWPFASKIRGRSPIYFWPFATKVRGRSPPNFVAVRHQTSWPFATKVCGRSPSKFVAVRHNISFGRSFKTQASKRVAVHLVRSPNKPQISSRFQVVIILQNI